MVYIMKNQIFKAILFCCALLFGATAVFLTCKQPKQPPTCNPPQNLRVIGVSPNSITVAWDSIPGGGSYQVSVNPQSNPPGPFITSQTTFTINGLEPNTKYTIQVRRNCGDGVFSSPATISAETSNIIIVDIIAQIDGSQKRKIGGLCNGATQTGPQNMPIGWTSAPFELLKIEVSPDILVFIIKDQTGLHSIGSGIICGYGKINNPPTQIGYDGSGNLTLQNNSLDPTIKHTISINVISKKVSVAQSALTLDYPKYTMFK